MTDEELVQPPIDPGSLEPHEREALSHDARHLIDEREWERIEQEVHGDLEPARRLGRSSFPSVSGFIQCRWDGGSQPGGRPTYGVLHDAETPLAPGYALSISNYFGRNTNQTSAHFMGGPDAFFQLLDTSRIGWHCGNGNLRSIGVEQAGYASLSRAQWLTESGHQQLARLAALMVDIRNAHGIGTYFMSDTQLLAAYRGQIVGGWATHDQCRRVLGGTSHTDPMPNFPFDVLSGVLVGQPVPAPTPPPAPVGRPPVFPWPLPVGHCIGAKTGPANCHGCAPGYDNSVVCGMVLNVLQWFIYRDCVPGVPPSAWATSSWPQGGWDAPYGDPACIRWHARYYPNQPEMNRVYSDDYARLVA